MVAALATFLAPPGPAVAGSNASPSGPQGAEAALDAKVTPLTISDRIHH